MQPSPPSLPGFLAETLGEDIAEYRRRDTVARRLLAALAHVGGGDRGVVVTVA